MRESDLPHKTGIAGDAIPLGDSSCKPQTAGGATIDVSDHLKSSS